ncbi:unnamed protein product [Meloidogyne enterolobii]|uniref:Uncharacterized protein n=1 Tax=Meloidogyne enterolobii TaxID=390850 RepID=A0ACB0ZMD2_MELEN
MFNNFKIILFLTFFLFIYLNINFIESRNILSKKGQKLFLNKKREILKNSTKIKNNDEEKEEFFIDYAMLSYESIDNDAIYYFHDNCYYDEEKFEEYCYMDKMSAPINAKFDDELYDVEFFVDELVDSQGNTIVNISRDTTFTLYSMFFRNIIQGNKEDITKISNALDAHYYIRYYFDGLCNDTKIKRNELSLKFNDANITIHFDGSDLAGYSHDNICEIEIWDWEGDVELKFALPVFNNYCIFFDSLLQQIAFSPRKKEEIEWSYCHIY